MVGAKPAAPDAPKDEPQKANPESGKTSPASGLFQIILRYEGDGIIDANVVNLLKELYGKESPATSPLQRWSTSNVEKLEAVPLAPSGVCPAPANLPVTEPVPSDTPTAPSRPAAPLRAAPANPASGSGPISPWYLPRSFAP